MTYLFLVKRIVLLLSIVFLTSPSLALENKPSSVTKSQAQKSGPYTTEQLEKMSEPIALYPDVLIGQILPASTFPDQIIDAALFLDSSQDASKIQTQPWDPSVKSIANYPSVVALMAADVDWTICLGDAFLHQHKELLGAIQRLRARAKAVGNLRSNENINVSEVGANGNSTIQIQPAYPESVYVPPATTTVVYESESPSYTDSWVPVATLGLGMALGYAIGNNNNDDDHYYYGGPWYGGGFWHDDDAFDDWMDFRKDRWNDINDHWSDRQDFRQDVARDRWDNMSDSQKQNFQNNWKQKRDSWQKASPEQKQNWANQQRTKHNVPTTAASVNRQQWAQESRAKLQGMSPSQKEDWARSHKSDFQAKAAQRKDNWNSMSSSQRQDAVNRYRSETKPKIDSRTPSAQQRSGYAGRSTGYAGKTNWGSSSTRSGAFSGNSWGARNTAMQSSRGSFSRGGGGGRMGGGRGRR